MAAALNAQIALAERGGATLCVLGLLLRHLDPLQLPGLPPAP